MPLSSPEFPSNAARGGATTLTGAGNVADIFTFTHVVQLIVQNNTNATIYVTSGVGGSAAATQGDEALPAGAEMVSLGVCNWVSVYGAAATKVNGTTSGGIVIYGVQ